MCPPVHAFVSGLGGYRQFMKKWPSPKRGKGLPIILRQGAPQSRPGWQRYNRALRRPRILSKFYDMRLFWYGQLASQHRFACMLGCIRGMVQVRNFVPSRG